MARANWGTIGQEHAHEVLNLMAEHQRQLLLLGVSCRRFSGNGCRLLRVKETVFGVGGIAAAPALTVFVAVELLHLAFCFAVRLCAEEQQMINVEDVLAAWGIADA